MRESWSHQDRRTVGHTLSIERRARRIRQPALAAALGISVSLLQKMEYGVRQPRAEVLVEWTRALKYPIEKLFNDVGRTPQVESLPSIANRKLTRADWRAIKNGSIRSLDKRREKIWRREAARDAPKQPHSEQTDEQHQSIEEETEEQKHAAQMKYWNDLFARNRATTGNATLHRSPPDPRDRRQVFDPLSQKISWYRGR